MSIHNLQFLRSFLTSISEGILVVDRKYTIVYANKALSQLFGYTEEELINQELAVLIPNRIKKQHTKFVDSYNKNPKQQKMSDRDGIFGLHKLGYEIPIEIGLNYFKNDDEQYAIAIISDLSSVKRTNGFLKNIHHIITNQGHSTTEKITDILELGCTMFGLNIGILAQIVEDDYIIKNIAANEKHKQALLAQPSLKVKDTFSAEVIIADEPIFRNNLSSSSANSNALWNLENFIGAKVMVEDKLYGTINFSSEISSDFNFNQTDLEILKLIAQLIGDMIKRDDLVSKLKAFNTELESNVASRTQELRYALKEIQDINVSLKTEVKKRIAAEEAANSSLEQERKLNDLKSRFVSMASHEFRTPLTGILSSATLAEKYAEIGNKEKHHKHIQTIKKSVNHLTSILNDILSLNKIESGVVACQPIQFDIAELTEDVVESMKTILKANQTLVVNKNIDGEPTVFQDEKLLHRALINLISNASKYSDEGKPIVLNVSKDSTNIIIQVKDSGVGIPLEDQQNIFTRFFRASNSGNVQGTGLGLNITKNYIELMQGSISFESEPELGSTFTLKIPTNYNEE